METIDRLRSDVAMLAGEIGPRHPGVADGPARALDFIEGRLRGIGLEPRREAFTGCGHAWSNLIADIPGPQPGTVVICAHYDSPPGDQPTPGADDNASGIAVLLELAQRVAARPRQRTVRILACGNEEGMGVDFAGSGSWNHLRMASERGERIPAALVLDALGWYDRRPGSQSWPAWWMPFVHGRRGDFLCLQAAWRDRALARTCHRAAGLASPLPVRGCWWPRQTWQLKGDQESFRRMGIPVMTLTDTDRFRNPRFHRPADLPETLDYAGLSNAVDAAEAVLDVLLRT